MERSGDSKNFFKTDRTFLINGQWYYSTREGIDQGPFESKQDAENEIALYIRRTIEKENMGSKKDQDD